MGSDESVLISVERINRDRVKMIDMEITTKTLLTETILRIKETDKKYDFKKIYIDDGGMGVGVFDPLISDEQTKRKIVGINNATRSIDKENKRKKKLLKEDLYTNLLRLMEQGKVELFDEPEIMLSLKSIQYENTDDKSMKIYGNYSHITEALVRSCWCVKDKTLNIYIY
jgi:ABC-type amino acid transport substrate-binding protein